MTLVQTAAPVAVATRFPTSAIYLARHATPDWNRRDIRYDIAPGPDLVPQGEAEAAQLGEFLRTTGVTRIYASPLVRTRRTAEIAAAIAGASVTIDEAVREYAREENDDAVFARFYPRLASLLTEADGDGPIAIVTHGGPVRVMLERLGLPSDEIWHYRRQFDHHNPLPPAAAWQLTPSPAGNEWAMRLAFSPTSYTDYLPATRYV